MKIRRVGVDLAKNVFQLHGTDHKGKALWKRRLARDKWLNVLFNQVRPGTEVGMEACAGANHWGRILCDAGYKVKIFPVWSKNSFVLRYQHLINDSRITMPLYCTTIETYNLVIS